MSTGQMDERGIIVACTAGGQRNRIAFGRRGKCSKCGTLLPDNAVPLDVPSVAAFDALVQASTIPVVVDFWAPWCGPCRMVAPELEKVAASHAGRYLVVKVNTDALPEFGERYTIRSIPTMMVFVEGREAGRTSGARPAPDIEAFVEHAVRTPISR
jgi:thioredoxin 2